MKQTLSMRDSEFLSKVKNSVIRSCKAVLGSHVSVSVEYGVVGDGVDAKPCVDLVVGPDSSKASFCMHRYDELKSLVIVDARKDVWYGTNIEVRNQCGAFNVEDNNTRSLNRWLKSYLRENFVCSSKVEEGVER